VNNDAAVSTVRTRIARILHLLTTIALLATGTSDAQEHDAARWEHNFRDDIADIDIYYQTNQRGYVEFRGITRVRSSLGAFVAVFLDVEKMPAWVYRAKKVTTLAVISKTDIYAHTLNAMPWPLDDRDALVRTTLSQNPRTLAITITSSGVPDYLPELAHSVRIPVAESFWRFTPLDEGMVEIEFQGYGEPGGALSSIVPHWMIRLLLFEVPYQTLIGLKKVIVQTHYQAQIFDFVDESEQ
jgi:hypothetical protein